jgi:SNF family Na+-dependent transporter
MAGNAVGLGNFLRFPAQAMQNGGGAFIIPYLISFILMGIPLLWMEWAIGRYGGRFGYHHTPGALDAMGRTRIWKYFGVFGIFTNLTVAAFYCYVESWSLAYVWYSVTGVFSGMSVEEVSSFYSAYVDTGQGSILNLPGMGSLFFIITLILNVWILSRGISKGIEATAKIAMPALLLFGIILAIRSLTLGPGVQGARFDSLIGLNHLWEPQLDALLNPSIWLAAAGQIFFTLSVGMGSIHCYAAYLRENDDIALNAASAGWMNEFVEVVLGGSIIIPIAVAYMGLPWIQENINFGGGFGIGFQTMPTLFQYWGPLLSVLAGVAWFGLLFFAGITSSLAMGQPVMAFLQDEFKLTRTRSAGIFGMATLLLALPCILFFEAGAFNEFNNWSGTFSLVVFALAESILFAWVFGVDRGWDEIKRGADLKVPHLFRWIIKYVTPLFLLVVFFGSFITPDRGDWRAAFASLFRGDGWPFAPGSLIGTLLHLGVDDTRWFIDGEPTEIFILDATRVLLVLTFALIAMAVRQAWKRKTDGVW